MISKSYGRIDILLGGWGIVMVFVFSKRILIKIKNRSNKQIIGGTR